VKRLALAIMLSLCLHVMVIVAFGRTDALVPGGENAKAPTKVVLMGTLYSKETGGEKTSEKKLPESKETTGTAEIEDKAPVEKTSPEPEKQEQISPNEIVKIEEKEEPRPEKKENRPSNVKNKETKKVTELQQAETPSKTSKVDPERENNAEEIKEKVEKELTETDRKLEDLLTNVQGQPEKSNEPEKTGTAGKETEEQKTGTDAVAREITEEDVTRRIKPDYPRASRLRQEEGTVVIIAQVSGGRVTDVKIESSSGHERLDHSALKAVKKWQFSISGEEKVRIPVVFRLNR
jgi:protein TonB